MTRKSTASSWLWSGNKYYYIIYYDNIWQNVDIFLNKKQETANHMACINWAGRVPTFDCFLYRRIFDIWAKIRLLKWKIRTKNGNKYYKINVWEYLWFTVSINDNNVRRVSNDQLIYKSINVNVSCIVSKRQADAQLQL